MDWSIRSLEANRRATVKHSAVAFGLVWRSDVPLPNFEPVDEATADVEVCIVRETLAREEVARHRNAVIFEDGVRYYAYDGSVLDIVGTNRIDVMPGPNWQGALPVHFWGTISALLLALRGFLPIHGTAVEVGGRAVLLCGRSGAGKSTVAANLVALGAKLISDDLSVLRMVPGDVPRLLAGRPGMRVHRETADWLLSQAKVDSVVPSYDSKVVVRPLRVEAFSQLPLERIVLLDSEEAALPKMFLSAVLRAQIFRREIMRKLSGHNTRMDAIAEIVERIDIKRIMDLSRFDRDDALKRANCIFAMQSEIVV